MADSNNARAATLPASPHPQVRQLDRLVGRWEATGSLLTGAVSFSWMEGGFFFLIQQVDAHAGGRTIRGIEYIGWDEDTETLRSHYLDIHGANFAYTWEVDDQAVRVWFGDKGSDNFFVGRFNEDGSSYSGAWQWPGGGYRSTLTRR
jgi:hypothetical protein